jgi:deoxyribonuclease-4
MKKNQPTGPQGSAPLLGAHLSIAGGIWRSIERADKLDCRALQIFVKNASRWKAPALQPGDVERFKELRKRSELKVVYAHDAYLINLASPSDELWEKSITAFQEELCRCQLLGLDGLVAHPGCHCGSGEAKGVKRVAEALNRILVDQSVPVVLETTAGQGSCLGYRFEQLRDILAGLERPEEVSVCLDTCHVFAAGYDLRSIDAYERTLGDLDRCVGLDRLRVIHVNDSKTQVGSRVDRHEHLGKGTIGRSGFMYLMNDPGLRDVPKILETPKGVDGKYDAMNLKFLESLVIT